MIEIIDGKMIKGKVEEEDHDMVMIDGMIDNQELI